MRIVMSMSNLLQRDFLAGTLRNLGNSVTPKPCLADAKDYVQHCSQADVPDLVILQDDGHCNAFEIARAIEKNLIDTVAIVLVSSHGRADYPDVATVVNHGTAEQLAGRIITEYEKQFTPA